MTTKHESPCDNAMWCPDCLTALMTCPEVPDETKLDYEFPFREQCQACADERLHHHTGERTKGMPARGRAVLLWL